MKVFVLRKIFLIEIKMENILTLYHGSNCNFNTVDLSKAKDKRDFGKGFYLTTLQSQAKDWAEVLFARFG